MSKLRRPSTVLAAALVAAVGAAGAAVALALPVTASAGTAAAAITWSAANSVATGDQDGPSVATNGAGDIAVVWEDDRDPGFPEEDSDSEIFLRLYRNGTAQFEKKLSTVGADGTNWKHLNPDVGLDERGNAVVVWADDADGNEAFNVSYRVVSPAGAVLASGRANASTAGNHILPRVAVDPDGVAGNATAVAFSVVWEDVQGSVATIRAAGYTNVATKAYEVVASQSTGSHHHPDVAVPASGDALVVWDEDADANGSYNVGLTKLAPGGGAVTLSRRLANSNSSGQQHDAVVAANAAGAFAVAWESDHTGTAGVWLRSFAADGSPRHADAAVSSGSGAVGPSIGVDGSAYAVVGWSVQGGNPDVWVRGFNPDGTGAGRLAAQVLGQSTTGRQEQLAVAVSPQGRVPLCYTDDRDGDGFDDVVLGLGASNADAAPAIKPISWWENRYLADEEFFNDLYGQESRSGDSWDYYDLAYGLDDVVAMYLATGKTHYLDQALLWTTNAVDRARLSSTLGANAYGDSYLGWISNLNGSTGEEVPLYESYAWRYVTRMLRVIRQTPALYANATYRAQYDRLLAFTEVNIFDKWYARGVDDTIYRSHTHLAAHWAYIAMNLSLMTTDATRLAREKTVLDNINYHLPNYANASLHGQLVASPVDPGGYFWNWEWGQFSRPGSDVSHGNAVVAYVVEARDLGLGGWTGTDVQRFVVTFDKVIWKVDGGPYAEFVDGSGSDNGWFVDGWMKLGRYDARLQQRLETHDVARSDGNGALNAKVLGAPY